MQTTGLGPALGMTAAASSNIQQQPQGASSARGPTPGGVGAEEKQAISRRSAKQLWEENNGLYSCCECQAEVPYEEDMFICAGLSRHRQVPCEHTMCDQCIDNISGEGPRTLFCDCAHVVGVDGLSLIHI